MISVFIAKEVDAIRILRFFLFSFRIVSPAKLQFKAKFLFFKSILLKFDCWFISEIWEICAEYVCNTHQAQMMIISTFFLVGTIFIYDKLNLIKSFSITYKHAVLNADACSVTFDSTALTLEHMT